MKTKREVLDKITKMTPQELLCLPLNPAIQGGGWPQKFKTVGEYIEAGREQTNGYLEILERNQGQRPLGYVKIWDVGDTTIFVEQIL
jgi:hypothetical protein